MRHIADSIRQSAQETGYGFFPGGDPREFFPDGESCSNEELEAHRVACAEWDAGTGQDIGGPCTVEHVEIERKDGSVLSGPALVTRAHYGIGTYTMSDPDIEKLAQQLDDWMDAAAQAGI
ncbi:MAG: hypothetical protein O7G84_01110 [Gammaproteobacteria bacterium]|nr:hypothetical protein [Gammaproteobacteria bacterium]